MGKITLAIETSFSPSSVSLLDGQEILQQYDIEEAQQTSALLSNYIQKLIKNNLKSPQQIDNVAVSIGPGSFTGLRVGVSAAKGMVFVIQKPLLAVDTLFALYKAFIYEHSNSQYDFYIPMIDARKDKAFIAVYDKNGHKVEENQLVYLEEKLSKKLNDNTILLPLNTVFSKFINESSFDCQVLKLNSSHIGLVASESNEVFDEQKIAYLEPNYIVNNYV